MVLEDLTTLLASIINFLIITTFSIVRAYRRNKKKNRALLSVLIEDYKEAINIYNDLNKGIFISQRDKNENYICLSTIHLIDFNEALFFENINNVTYKKYFTSKSFLEAIYYLRKNDLNNYHQAKDNITKNYNLRYRLEDEKEKKLNSYLFILETLEEKENFKNEDIMDKFFRQVQMQNDLVAEYFRKLLEESHVL